MNSGLEDMDDMDEEPEGENQNVNNSTMTTPDTTLNTESTERNSLDITHTLLPPRTDSPEWTRHSANLSRSSYDHHGSDESHARLIDVRRGDAPAYETIDLDVTEEPLPTHRRQNSQSGRISGFFSRFMPHRGNNGDIHEPTTFSPPQDVRNSVFFPSHSREPSAQSGARGTTSTDLHGSPGGSRLSRTHRDRINNSSTGSVFTVLSRTLSRNPDDGALTSPSLISLNSISPPLTHTATRTEFTYPRTGPTSEQVKFLASKETFGRFGLPYGPDAVAFAASSSRQDLPPDFDSIHRPSFSDLSPNPGDGSDSSLRRSMSARRLSTGDHSDRGDSPFPESVEPSPDLASPADPLSQLPLSKQKSSPNLGVGITSSQNSISRQKSTPDLGMGHPPLSKSASKSKLIANLQSDGNGSFPPRSASAAGSYMTMESFRTAHDDAYSSAPSSPTATLGVPQITIELPSNNPSVANLAEDGSSSETEEFFDGDEGTEDGEGEGEEGENISGGGNKTPKATSVNEGRQSHAEGGDQEDDAEDDSSSMSDEDDDDSSASESESDPKLARGVHSRTPTSSSSSDLGSGSGDESEAETHSNHTEVDKTFVTTDSETNRIPHIREGTDVTLTPEIVAATLGTSSPDLTKTNEISRTTVIEA